MTIKIVGLGQTPRSAASGLGICSFNSSTTKKKKDKNNNNKKKKKKKKADD